LRPLVARSLKAVSVAALTPLVLVRSCPLVGQGLPSEVVTPIGLGARCEATHPSVWAYPTMVVTGHAHLFRHPHIGQGLPREVIMLADLSAWRNATCPLT
jgi:hypothetical protein